MALTITKEFSFDSAHKLHDTSISDEMNEETFGKCFSTHGHLYRLFVTVSGDVNYGMVINFSTLKQIVNDCVIDKLDHKMLNDVDMFTGMVTTCENMILVIWRILEPVLRPHCRLVELKLYETPTSYATFRGDYY